jgi:hypothetical protein
MCPIYNHQVHKDSCSTNIRTIQMVVCLQLRYVRSDRNPVYFYVLDKIEFSFSKRISVLSINKFTSTTLLQY